MGRAKGTGQDGDGPRDQEEWRAISTPRCGEVRERIMSPGADEGWSHLRGTCLPLLVAVCCLDQSRHLGGWAC